MCFSAAASFISSVGLSGVGTATITKTNKRKFLVAVLPLLFGFQQFIEGIQWIMTKNGDPSLFFGYAFLFFAFFLWPIYIPIAVYKAEQNKERKQLLKWLIAAGIIVSTFTLLTIINNPLIISIIDGNLVYDLGPRIGFLGVVSYVGIIILSMVISTERFIRDAAIVFFIAATIAWFAFNIAFYSVWCFFAAALSGLVYFYIKDNKSKNPI